MPNKPILTRPLGIRLRSTNNALNKGMNRLRTGLPATNKNHHQAVAAGHISQHASGRTPSNQIPTSRKQAMNKSPTSPPAINPSPKRARYPQPASAGFLRVDRRF